MHKTYLLLVYFFDRSSAFRGALNLEVIIGGLVGTGTSTLLTNELFLSPTSIIFRHPKHLHFAEQAILAL